MNKPKVYLTILQSDPKSNLNLYNHGFFHSKREMDDWLKVEENKNRVKGVYVAEWVKCDESD